MNKYSKLLSIILAMLLIIGSIAISGIAFGEGDDPAPTNTGQIDVEDESNENTSDTSEVEQPKAEQEVPLEDESSDHNKLVDTETYKNHTPSSKITNLVSTPVTGSIKTTDFDGNSVNKNHYKHKEDVYVRSDGVVGDFYVRVMSPQGDELGVSSNPITINDRDVFNLWEAVGGYWNTNNNGDVYHVDISLTPDFAHSYAKSDNFKVTEDYVYVIVKKEIVDQDGNPLNNEDKSGFIFTLGGETETTDSSGEVRFLILETGTYNLSEKNRQGYELITQIQPIEVNNGDLKGNNKDKIIIVENKKLPPTPPVWKGGKIIITKTQWGLPKGKLGIRPLENPNGITFILYDEEGNEFDTATTKRVGLVNGIATFDKLPEGNYSLKEDVPTGYTSSLKEDGKPIRITKHHPLELVLVSNFKQPEEDEWLGEIEVIKSVYDEEIEDYLHDNPGFKFVLYAINGDEETPYTDGTTEKGKLTFTVPEGLYRVEEELSEEQAGKYIARYSENPISLNRETSPEKKVTIEVTNIIVKDTPKPKIKIQKIVRDHNRDPLTNNQEKFTFELYRLNDVIPVSTFDAFNHQDWTLVGTYDLYGNDLEEIDVDDYGKYRVIEVDIGDYTPDEEIIEVEIDEENNEALAVFTNIKKKPYVPIPDPKDPKDPEPDPERPDRPEKPEKPKDPIVDDEIEIVTPEPEPEVQPEPEPIPEPEVVVVVEPVPEAVPTLPKTGSASPFIYSGLGTALLGLGIYLKKKEE